MGTVKKKKKTKQELRAMFALGRTPGGSNFADSIDSNFNLEETGTQIASGSLKLLGNITATEYIISSSVTNRKVLDVSGSTHFGDDMSDIHTRTGSMYITGSIFARGSLAQGTGGTITGLYSHAEGLNTVALGNYSHAEGNTSDAYGVGSHAEGYDAWASGSYSHAEGYITKAGGYASHAEGHTSQADGDYSHAEGWSSDATGNYSHAEGRNAWASGSYSHAEGYSTKASNLYSHAEGQGTIASGIISHAEGLDTIASGVTSHAEGFETSATTYYSHAEGQGTRAISYRSHAEGYNTLAGGSSEHQSTQAHAEGYYTTASADQSHAEGYGTKATGDSSHAEGQLTIASGENSHAEGKRTLASGDESHAEGSYTSASGDYSHAEGTTTKASSVAAHAEGTQTSATGAGSHAEGYATIASGHTSHAEGVETKAAGSQAHAEGLRATASGDFSHAEGAYTVTWGTNSHAEGTLNVAAAPGSHAEGYGNRSQANYSHAEGFRVTSSANYSHAEGINTKTFGVGSHAEGTGSITGVGILGADWYKGWYSHAEGYFTNARGRYSHAEGMATVAYGTASHAEGVGTIASGSAQSVVGWYNTQGNPNSYFVIGDGTSDGARSDLALFNAASITLNAPVSSSIFSGSFVGDGSNLTNLPAVAGGLWSGSAANPRATGDVQITGSLTISGSFIAGGHKGSSNTIIGIDAGLNANADNNVLIGYSAGKDLSHAGSSMNVAVGNNSMGAAGSSAGTNNVAIGQQSLYNINGGDHNVAIGNSAGTDINSGTSNIVIGSDAGVSLTTGNNNVLIGQGTYGNATTTAGAAGMANTLRIGAGTVIPISASLVTGDVLFPSTASAEYFVGDGSQLTDVSAFPFVGDAVITGSLTVTTGVSATSLTASANLSVYKILISNNQENVILGNAEALTKNSEEGSVKIGFYAGYLGDSGGDYSTLIGRLAGRNNTTAYNVAIGSQALGGGDGGIAKTGIGTDALYNCAGNYNIGLGYKAGYYLTSGVSNIIIGHDAASGSAVAMSSQLFIGSGSLAIISGSLLTGDIIFPSTASAAYFVGDGSNLTGLPGGGIFTTTGGYEQAIGNLIISSSNSTASLQIIGSGSTVFEIQGSSTTLFSVTDDMTGELFAANDASGLSIISAHADRTVKLGKPGGFGIVISGSNPMPTDADARIEIQGSTYFTGTTADFSGVGTVAGLPASDPFPYSGSAIISSSFTPGDTNSNALKVIGSGSVSGSGIFEIVGSVGTLFSATDTYSGSLMAVTDASGIPILEVFSDNTVTANGFKGWRPYQTQGSSFVLQLSDMGTYNRCGGVTVTASISASSAIPFALGTEIEFFQTSSAGNLFITSSFGSGVIINSKNGNLKLAGQFSAATLKKVGTDEWDLIGDLT